MEASGAVPQPQFEVRSKIPIRAFRRLTWLAVAGRCLPSFVGLVRAVGRWSLPLGLTTLKSDTSVTIMPKTPSFPQVRNTFLDIEDPPEPTEIARSQTAPPGSGGMWARDQDRLA